MINLAGLVSPSEALLAELVLFIFWLLYVIQKWVKGVMHKGMMN